MIPTDPIANVSHAESVASLLSGGSVKFSGSGNGQICEGYELTNGIPSWALNVLVCWGLGMVFIALAWTRWNCIDDHTQKKARGSVVMNKAFSLPPSDAPTSSTGSGF
jgi:hypothetical protein